MTEYRIGNVIISVTRPELTPEERNKRERNIQNALNQFGKAMHEEEGEELKAC